MSTAEGERPSLRHARRLVDVDGPGWTHPLPDPDAAGLLPRRPVFRSEADQRAHLRHAARVARRLDTFRRLARRLRPPAPPVELGGPR